MNKHNQGGGIFDFARNFRHHRELGNKLKCQEKDAEQRAHSDRQISNGLSRKIEKLRSEQRRVFLKILAGFGAIVVTGGGLTAGAISLFGEDEAGETKLPSLPSVPKENLHTVDISDIPEDKKVKNLTQIEQPETAEGSDFEKMLALQKQWKKLSTKSISLFIGADPRVEQLLAFMDSNAFYSIPMGPVATQQVSIDDPTAFIKQTQNPYGFEVVYMPEEFSRHYPSSIVTQDGPTLRVIAEFKTLQWLGLMLLHELSHVEDIRVKHEDTHDKKQWLDGEVRAHAFEMNLLRFVDPNAYQFLIEKGTPLYLTGDREILVQFIEKLYRLEPAMVSEREKSLFTASCIMAIAFEDAKKHGADNSKLTSVYRDVAKRYGNLDL